METRIYKGDKWTQLYGSRIPIGARVKIVKFCPRRTVIVEYKGERMTTKLWCLEKRETRIEEIKARLSVFVTSLPKILSTIMLSPVFLFYFFMDKILHKFGISKWDKEEEYWRHEHPTQIYEKEVEKIRRVNK